MIETPTIEEFFRAYLTALEDKRNTLDRLDAVAGDGDHGATMLMGAREVVATLGSDRKPGETLRVAAEAFASVGGSIGPLWGTALLRAARVAGSEPALDLPLISDMVLAAVVGMEERGRSQVGDKTLLDVMKPAADALEEGVKQGLGGAAAIERALRAARVGLDGTAEMRPRRGRARRLADRSIGFVDPGAASAWLAWETVAILMGIDSGVGLHPELSL
jgi:dihydroxyacetone kinase-like protein